jgi:hypothetical protein
MIRGGIFFRRDRIMCRIGHFALLVILLAPWVMGESSFSTFSTSQLQAPGSGTVRLEKMGDDKVQVSSHYWILEFDLKNGGVLKSIVFPHGSGKNLLLDSLSSSVGPWSERNSPTTNFASSRDGDVLQLTFSGAMAKPDRLAGPVEYETQWSISGFTVRLDQRIRLKEEMNISTAAIGSLTLRGELDEFGLRRGPEADSDPRKQAPASFGRIEGKGDHFIDEHHAPIYLLFFQRGVEGLDLSMASDLDSWEKGFAGSAGSGHYAASATSDGSGLLIRRQPLSLPRPVRVQKGEYTFSYYLGLPRLVEKSNRKWRHLSFGNHPWPSDSDIHQWAENGVNVVRLHNDYTEDENFWHDGAWPPYDQAGMSELRRVIATCHKFKIKVIPYFSIHELHPKAPGYQENEQAWKRTNDQVGTVYHNLWGKGEFGAQMCPLSGWLERRKKDVKAAYSELGFDGIYYDWVWGMSCNNKNHNAQLHLGTDGIVDFLAWTRRLIGPEGILVLHLYGQMPSISLENYADLVVNMEEYSDSEKMMKMADVPLVTYLAESIPRSPCPSYRKDRGRELNQNNIAHLVSLGMFPWSDPQEEGYPDALTLFRTFLPYKLEDFKLHDALTDRVKTGWEDVYGAVYASPEQALIILSNTANQPRKKVIWRVIPGDLGFVNMPQEILVKDTLAKTQQHWPISALSDGSLETELSPYQYKVFEITSIR